MTRIDRFNPSNSLGRTLAWFLLVASVLVFAAVPAQAAPIGWSAFVGNYFEGFDDFFAGAGARISLGTITVSPNAEYIFVDSGNAFTLNVDGTLTVLPLGVASGYVGGGIGLVTVDPDGGESDTNTGINLIAGVGFNAVVLKPFAQFKYVFLDNDDLIGISVGTRF